jgi:hypothetical protein
MKYSTKLDHDEVLIYHRNTTINQTGEYNIEFLSLY